MTTKRLFTALLWLCLSIFLSSNAMAYPPKIQLIFTDPQDLCEDKSDQKTHLQFTYGYQANQDFQYFSKIISVEKSKQYIAVPTPIDQNYQHPYTYTAFEITSAGDCGNNEINYSNYGNCYLVNLLPTRGAHLPFSYIINISPQYTGVSADGAPSYNLVCNVTKT